MSPTPKPHVLIVGAGLGGLTLAQALRKRKISFEIFDRDTAILSRRQGWAIALHLVLDRLREELPDDLPPLEMTSHLLPLSETSQISMYNADGTVVAQMTDGDKGLKLLRSNRARLREYLANKIHVQWSKELENVNESDDKVTLHFKDGSTATGDILVGADGAHSKVRAHLFPAQCLLRQTPTCLYVGEVTLTREQYLRQFDISRSAYLVFGSSSLRHFVGLSSIDQPAGVSAKYYWMTWHIDPAAENNPEYFPRKAGRREIYNRALELTAELHPKFREIIYLTGEEGILIPPLSYYDLILPDLPPNRKITLLGDAAHAMMPNRGEGGNHAVTDALNLARSLGTLSQSDNDLDVVLLAYQNEMLERGRAAVKASWSAGEDDGQGTTTSWKSIATRQQSQ